MPELPPAEQPERAPIDHGNASSPATEKDAKASRRPTLGPPVFGRYCWWIVVVPYVLYLAGTQGAGYVEWARSHAAINQQKSAINQTLSRLLETASERAPAEEFVRFEEEVGIGKFVKAFVEIEHPKPETARSDFKRMLEHPLTVKVLGASTVLDQAKTETKHYVEMLEADEKKRYREVLEASHRRNLERADGIERVELQQAAENKWFPGDRTWYPAIYALTVIVTTIVVLIVGRGYFKAPFNFSWLSVAVGAVGIVVWIVPWWLDVHYLGWFAKLDARAAFNPFEEMKDHPDWMRQFLAIRFFGLVLLVPLIEEFFLRGFLMRYIDDPDWDQIPLATLGKWTLLGIMIYAGMSHPSELPSALAWFGLMTWLYIHTKSIWNCVIAHAITNLLLALYVIYTGTWALW